MTVQVDLGGQVRCSVSTDRRNRPPTSSPLRPRPTSVWSDYQYSSNVVGAVARASWWSVAEIVESRMIWHGSDHGDLTPALDVDGLIDRLVGHGHSYILVELGPQPGGDLLGGPQPSKVGLHPGPQLGVAL